MDSPLSHISEQAIRLIQHHIAENRGNEVMFIGQTDSDGLVIDVRVAARGNEGMVPAVLSAAAPGNMLIHNHPSGDVRPSEQDLLLAATAAERGIGSLIVDNMVRSLFVMVEYLPPEDDTIEPLDLSKVGAVLGEGGVLSSVLSGYEVRGPQLDMAEAVTRTLNKKGLTVIEAGTGTGKSFAYLVPAILWLSLNRRSRVVISTSTIALEEQLIHKDIPLLLEQAGIADISVALLKGRSNYLCLRKFADFKREHMQLSLNGSGTTDIVDKLDEQIAENRDGSRSSFSVELSGETWQQICSNDYECSAGRCRYFEKCFFFRSRRRANAASLVLVNHHLLMADISVRSASNDEQRVIPEYDVLVVDEAHNLFRSAISFMGDTFSSYSLLRILKRLHNRAKNQGLIKRIQSMVTADADIIALDSVIRDIMGFEPFFLHSLYPDMLAILQKENRYETMFSLDDTHHRSELIPFAEEIISRVERIVEKSRPIVKKLSAEVAEEQLLPAEKYTIDSLLTDAGGALAKLEDTISFLRRFFSPESAPDYVFWGETHGKTGIRFTITPLDLQKVLAEELYDKVNTVIFSSATLSTSRSEEGFSFFLRESGISRAARTARTVLLPAYFDYRNQLRALVVTDAPMPTEPSFADWVVRRMPELLEASGGGALVLFTNISQRNAAADAIRSSVPFSLLVQGESHSSTLLNRFRKERNSVLFATDLFWEGIDVKGDALRSLILVRLPFSFPRHPFIKRYLAKLEEETGKKGFTLYTLPMAVLKFKQGIGRLIRTKDDTGTVVVLDKRLLTHAYGRNFKDALPEAISFTAVSSERLADSIRLHH